jgi:SAM-dependent methyltransferase
VPALYDRIGRTYAQNRQPDPHIVKLIDDAIGESASVLSIGSGTGSYEPSGRRVVAVEPSRVMIEQRPRGSAPVVQGVAEYLPVAAGSFDVALAVLTIHHWSDHVAGLREMSRIAERQVILTWDPSDWESFWLVADYVPEIPKAEATVASFKAVVDVLDVDEVQVVPVPWNCTDGFCGAYWRRPEQYLDPDARAAISGFTRCDPQTVDKAMLRLEREIADGTWTARYGDLLELDEIDLGYRLVVASGLR